MNKLLLFVIFLFLLVLLMRNQKEGFANEDNLISIIGLISTIALVLTLAVVY